MGLRTSAGLRLRRTCELLRNSVSRDLAVALEFRWCESEPSVRWSFAGAKLCVRATGQVPMGLRSNYALVGRGAVPFLVGYLVVSDRCFKLAFTEPEYAFGR